MTRPDTLAPLPISAAGLHAVHPDLRAPVDGDPRYSIDFRRVYATLLGRWLGCPCDSVLGGRFEPLAVL